MPKHVEGVSIRRCSPIQRPTWDHPALTTHGRNNHAVRSERWRYIRYADGGEELYDHDADPLEWKNLASDPKLASVKAELAQSLPKTNIEDAPAKAGGKAKAVKKAAKESEASARPRTN